MSYLLKKIIIVSLFLLCSAATFAQTITSFSPTTITAGTGSILTIEGTGFGTTQGLAAFRDPDVGTGAYTLTYAIDIVSWSDTRITVRVPSEAATGRFIVQLANGTNIFSSTDITVKYSILNVYNPDNSSILSKMINHNGLGGYTFQLNTDFNSNAAAVASFTRALNSWKCASNVNWSIGVPTTINADVLDGANVVRYGNTSEVGAGILAYCRTWRTKCATGNWETVELDIVVNNSQPWHYTTDVPSFSNYDFETVAVHELGHAHGLEHVNNTADFMHFSIARGAVKRTLNPFNLEAAQYVMNYSIAATGSTCFTPMVALPSGSCATPAPTIASFTPTSAKTGTTVTITGTNFANVLGVSFGATNASAFTVVSPTSITATVGAGATGSITVSTASGSAALTGFTFIPKTAQTITAPGWQSRTFGDADFDHNISASSSLPVTIVSSNEAVATIVGGKIHIVAAGSSTITANQAGNNDFDAATTLNLSLTVNKANQTITFPALLAVATNTPDYDPGATASSGLAVAYTSSNTAVVTIVGGKIHPIASGTATITASQSGNSNYNAATAVDRSLTVGKQSQTITFNAIPNKVFGDPDFDIGATVSSGLPLSYTSSDPAVATIVGNKIHIVAAGSSTITASQAGNDDFAAATTVNFSLTVNKANQTITFPVLLPVAINSPDYDPGATASSGIAVVYTTSNPLVATIVGVKIHVVALGTATITASQSGNSNYNAATAVDRSLTVVKQSQTITFNAIPDKVIGDPDFNIGATVSSGLPLSYTSSNPAVAIIVGAKIRILAAGNTTITVLQAGNATYDPAPNRSRNLTVYKLQQTITFNTIPNKVISDPDFDIGATVSSGLPLSYVSSNPEVATFVGEKIHILAAGNTTITVSQYGSEVYDPAPDVTQNVTVSKLQQTITFNTIPNKVIGDPDFDIGAIASSGLPLSYTSSNPAVAIIVGAKIRILAAGNTTITVSQFGNATYIPAPNVSQNLTVSKLQQAITFNAFANKVFGDPDFEIGAIASSGLAPTYISSDPSIASIAGTKVHILNAGTVNITAVQPGNSTYDVAPNMVRSLTINKAQQTISFSEIGFKNYNDPDFTLSATSSAGLPVSYKSANTNIATVSGNQIHIVSEGSVLITATQPGNANYNAAPDVNRELVVGYSLPATNFKLQSTDETCKTSNNGIIAITATLALNYTAVITGNNKNITQAFSTSTQLTGLEAGVYSICITVAGSSTYKQCFEAIIKEPKDLAVYSSINKDGNSVLLKLEGGNSYTIELNGEVITTTQQEISLPLIKGNNHVKISTDKTCQGVVEKAFLNTNSVLIYPNPVKDVLNINMGSTVANNIKVDIHSLDGRLVQTSNQRVEYGRIALNLPQLPRGLYILTLTSKNEKTIHKFIKE